MSVRRAAAIVGVAESELGIAKGRTVFQLQAQAAKAALGDAGISRDEVDAVFVTGRWPGLTRSMAVAEYLGIRPRYSDATDIGGASFEAFLGHAAAAIQAGRCEVALLLYGSTQRSEASRSVAGPPPLLLDQYEQPFGLPKPIGAYALAAMRHMHLYGTTREQLAEVAVAARAWALMNPGAYTFDRGPLTVAEVVDAPMICEPLGRYDCCLVTDGGGAVVVVSAERARDARKPPIWLLGAAETHTHESVSSMPDLTVTGAAQTGPAALAMAGVSLEDIDVVEIYDSFTITVLLTLEALGFCQPGESGVFVAGGRIAPGGEFPMNTDGGGLAYCHPGMYGIFLLIEAVRQLRGECGARQIPEAELALVHGTGSAISSSATCILGRA